METTLDAFVLQDLRRLDAGEATFPRWARDPEICRRLEAAAAVLTVHSLSLGDARPFGLDPPLPLELATRLVRMFSFVGDTVGAPFLGSGMTIVAVATWGRDSIGVEVDGGYLAAAETRLRVVGADHLITIARS
jgi:hypothetical protein